MSEKLQSDFKALSERVQILRFNPEKVREFWEQPYAIVSRKPDEWYVISPTFVDFQIGWLEKTVKGWNYFIVNKFVNWLAHVPKDLQQKFNFKPTLPIKVYDHMVLTGKEHQEEAWNRYSKHLIGRVGGDRISVKRGHEFDLIADMIDDGILPFIPQPIKPEDLREDPWIGILKAQEELAKDGLKTDISSKVIRLRDYQQEAWEKFRQFGAIGVYWAFGAGKTFIGLYSMARIKGPKLIVVPTTTLKEQWLERINRYMPQFASEIEIETYHAYEKLSNREYKLVVFDECHRLPANTFSRLATMKMTYRMGLSATPYREDGRTDYIFALTGFPVGMDWNKILESGVIGKPTVTVYIVGSEADKLRKIEDMLKDDKKTIIYSYWLDLGEKVSKRFDLPFVYGGTSNRMDILRSANVAVVSSVGGEGVSLPDLERTIEIGFQYGSRREEGQLLGRLFHSTEKEPEHIILGVEP